MEPPGPLAGGLAHPSIACFLTHGGEEWVGERAVAVEILCSAGPVGHEMRRLRAQVKKGLKPRYINSLIL